MNSLGLLINQPVFVIDSCYYLRIFPAVWLFVPCIVPIKTAPQTQKCTAPHTPCRKKPRLVEQGSYLTDRRGQFCPRYFHKITELLDVVSYLALPPPINAVCTLQCQFCLQPIEQWVPSRCRNGTRRHSN